jgi:hypothetical protein
MIIMNDATTQPCIILEDDQGCLFEGNPKKKRSCPKIDRQHLFQSCEVMIF